MTDDWIDPSVCAELSEAMGDDFAAELVATFLDDAPNMLAALKTAEADGDAETFRRAAHSLKSNAQTFGARELARQAREMEMAGVSGSPITAAQLEITYTRTAEILKAQLDD